MARASLVWGCLFGGLSVALGAFGAHALKARLPEASMEILATANTYMQFHALALLVLGLFAKTYAFKKVKGPLSCFVGGVFLFSGSLYLYVFTGSKIFAMITPVGGSLFLVAWGWFLWLTLSKTKI